MNRKIGNRTLRQLTLAAMAVALCIPAVASAKSCDRECLGDVVTAFLNSLVAHDPKRAPLADKVRFTEDTQETPIGGGFWATASGIGDWRNDFLDVTAQTAAVQAVMEEKGSPVLFAARLKVEDRKITEIETMVVRGPREAMLFNLDELSGPSAEFTKMPPTDQLMPREKMIEIAMRYPAGLKAGSFVTSDAPFASGAYRLENGVRMAGPGCTFGPPACEDMRNQRIPTLAGMQGDVVAVDEQSGNVLLRLDFGPGSLMGGGRGGRGRGGPGGPDGGAAPPQQVLVTFEGFKVYGGQIHAVEAVFESMPENSPRGW
jgi:hypothetical protein